MTSITSQHHHHPMARSTPRDRQLHETPPEFSRLPIELSQSPQLGARRHSLSRCGNRHKMARRRWNPARRTICHHSAGNCIYFFPLACQSVARISFF
jgi:hypothetical protein